MGNLRCLSSPASPFPLAVSCSPALFSVLRSILRFMLNPAVIMTFLSLVITNNALAFNSTKKVQVYTTYAPAKLAEAYIAPLLEKDETINVFRGKIIVNASIYTHEKIRETLERIDKPSRNLLVNVRYSEGTIPNETIPNETIPNDALSKRPTSSETKRPTKIKTSIIHFSGSHSNGEISIKKEAKAFSRSLDEKTQTIRITEGQVGYIKGVTEVYKSTPVIKDGFITNQPRLVKNGTGYYISVRIKDASAKVSYSQQTPSKRKTRNKVKSQQNDVISEITIPLNQWTPLLRDTPSSTNTAQSNPQLEIMIELPQ